MKRVLRGARLIDARSDIADAWVLIDGESIIEVGSGASAPTDAEVVDLGDVILVPGFIDLHGHGGSGHGYDGGDGEGIASALDLHRRHGTTRSVLSLVAAPVEQLVATLRAVRRAMDHDPLILGAHLEGPFLSPLAAGAHEPTFLRAPDPRSLDTLLTAGDGIVRQMTIAPELPGATAAISRLASHGVVAAVGHTRATYDEARAAFDAGARLLTHAYNAMPGLHHRDPGPLAAAIADDRVTLELILDGHHVVPAAADVLLRAAPGRVALITDAMAAAGVGDGCYELGALAVTVAGGVARLTGTDTIAGSTLTQDAALRTAHRDAGATLQQAIAAVTAVQANALGLADRFGALAPGYAADVVALDAELRVRAVWAGGRRVDVGSGERDGEAGS